MTNRYAARCTRCGGWVPEGTGHLENRDGRWIVTHHECPEITSGLGIGGIGSDDHNIHTGLTPTVAPETLQRESARAGEQVCPAGTTYGIRTPGKRCQRCGRDADWNSGAGMYLCARHWDEY